MILGQANKKISPQVMPAAQRLYDAIVAQARQPFLYLDYQVPDTLDGRYDCICLHASVVIHCLAQMGESGHDMSQELFDTMFRDFMHNLRQIGVGDLSIARHFRRMSEGFHGRARAYDVAMASGEIPQMADAVARNVYRQDVPTQAANALAYYAMKIRDSMLTQESSKMLAGEVRFEYQGGRP